MPGYTTQTGPVDNVEILAQQWQDLQARSEGSFFQSWGWIGTWLRECAAHLEPRVLRVSHDGDLVGLGVFVNRDIRRRGVFRASALFLNEYPFDGHNMVIEYNGLLCAPGHTEAVYQQALDALLVEDPDVEELHLGALREQPDLDCLRAAAGSPLKLLIEETSTAWQVNLAGLEPGVDGFLATLSHNRRTQVRRSLRYYEAAGELQISQARDVDDALVFLDQLKALHTRHRRARGEGGAFANPEWERFHRRLISERFGAGEIQLLRVSNSQQTIGLLYNLVWRDRVYVMQTGFAEVQDRREMPGYVVHALAIAHNREQGRVLYDLMHGDELYKQILCDRSSLLCWAIVQKPRLKFRLENLAVSGVRAIRQRDSRR